MYDMEKQIKRVTSDELLQNAEPLLTCLDDSNVIIIQTPLEVNLPLLDVANKAQETLK